MRRLPNPLLLLAACLSFTALTACDRLGSREVVCPSIYIPPHATLDLSPAMSQEATYALEVEADGQKESCTLSISGISAAKPMGEVVQGPTTRAEMDCKLIGTAHITNEGYVADFRTAGTPKQLKLTIRRDGAVIHQSDNALTYAPAELHGKGCSKTPHARVTIALSKL